MRSALLVHGLSSSGETWWRVADALRAQGYEVTAPDLIGHGVSPAAERYSFADYAAALPAGPFDLVVGHSLGGAIAVTIADRARRIVLIDPVLEVPAAEWEEVRADQVAELDLAPADLAAARPHWDARDVGAKVAAVQAVDRRMVGATFDDNPGWNVLAAASAITVPTLILGGDHAVYSMLATETAEELAASNPLIVYRVVAGAGHSPHRDRPAETLEEVLAFAR